MIFYDGINTKHGKEKKVFNKIFKNIYKIKLLEKYETLKKLKKNKMVNLQRVTFYLMDFEHTLKKINLLLLHNSHFLVNQFREKKTVKLFTLGPI